MLGKLILKIRLLRKSRYISSLVQNGLTIGKNTSIVGDIFLDPSHCFLISIGNYCTLAPNVRLIAHDASMNRELKITRVGKIIIHDNCFIGDSVIILPGISIGPNAVVGAGSVVTDDVPQGCVAAGNPAKVISRFDDFMKKHEDFFRESEKFREEQFSINQISTQDKQKLLAYLEKHVGYLDGRKP